MEINPVAVFPENGKYMGAIEINGAVFKDCCVRIVEVTGITSVAGGTVEISDGVDTFSGVHVYMHTDYGCRRRDMLGLLGTGTSPADFFEKAALQFILKGGQTFHTWSDISHDWAGPFTAEDILAVAIFYTDPDTGSESPIAVISVIQNLNQTAFPVSTISPYDDPAGGWPTYRPMFIVTYKENSSGSWVYKTVLFDLVEGGIASIPDSGYTAMVSADFGEVASDYEYFFMNGAIKPIPDEVTLVGSYSWGARGWYYTYNSGYNVAKDLGGATIDPAWVPDTSPWPYPPATVDMSIPALGATFNYHVDYSDLSGYKFYSYQIVPCCNTPNDYEDIDFIGSSLYCLRKEYSTGFELISSFGFERETIIENVFGVSNTRTDNQTAKLKCNDREFIINFSWSINNTPSFVDMTRIMYEVVNTQTLVVLFNNNLVCEFTLGCELLGLDETTIRTYGATPGVETRTHAGTALSSGDIGYISSVIPIQADPVLEYILSVYKDFYESLADPTDTGITIEFTEVSLFFQPYDLREALL